MTIDDVLKQQIRDSEGVLDPELFQKKTPIQTVVKEDTTLSLIDIDVKNIQTSPEEQLGIGKPFDFDKDEVRSFTEWLKVTSFKPIQRTAEATIDKNEAPPEIKIQEPSSESALEKKFDLIDKFISSNPKISPVKDISPSFNLAQTKLVQNDSLMTETLARIYLEQKNYEKAIQSYRILILKYPEKSAFFADQIKAVKQLQANNTK